MPTRDSRLIRISPSLAEPVYKEGDCYKEAPSEPHAFLQWKDTNACLDVACVCGERGHVDGDSLYYIKCAACGRVFEVAPYVLLHEIPDGGSVRPKVFRSEEMVEIVEADSQETPEQVAKLSGAITELLRGEITRGTF